MPRHVGQGLEHALLLYVVGAEQLLQLPVGRVQQGQQQVGLLNLLVAVLGGDGLGVLHRLQGFLGIFLRVHIASRSFYKENQDFSRPNR